MAWGRRGAFGGTPWTLTCRNIGGAGMGEEGGSGMVVVVMDSEADASAGGIAEVSCETSISITGTGCVRGETLGEKVLEGS